MESPRSELSVLTDPIDSMFKKELVRGKGPWQRSRIGQGPQPGRHHVEKLTAEALDSDLDRYHLEAMKLKCIAS
ncbi:hypothetical protein NC653_020327 [Populus alba x Populus x berolinensis]|uniref:Uncharacterized protein n=1 Tax=Populus alba x Populus x berolinensis TaxID=444605 RepID=A0AAD6QED3_9ROSI|nr:hypothetical protein NC653_020327 [Populus alba x Populus x berolinensis]